MGTAHEEEAAKRGRSGESTSETLVWQSRTFSSHVHQQLAALLLLSPHFHACSPVCSSQPRNQSPEPAQDQLSRAPQPGLHARSSTFKGLDARPGWEEDFFHPQGAERPEKKPPGPLLRTEPKHLAWGSRGRQAPGQCHKPKSHLRKWQGHRSTRTHAVPWDTRVICPRHGTR